MADGPEREARDMKSTESTLAQRKRIDTRETVSQEPVADMSVPWPSPPAVIRKLGNDGIQEPQDYLQTHG